MSLGGSAAPQPSGEALQPRHGSSCRAFQQLCGPPGPARRAGGLGGPEAFSQRCNLTAPVGMFTARCHLRAYRLPPYLPPLRPDKPRCWWHPGEAPRAGDGSEAGGAAAFFRLAEDAVEVWSPRGWGAAGETPP